jgi:Obg family GTPase CgtA
MWDESLGQVVQKPGYEQIFDTPDDDPWEDPGDESIEEEHEKELELYQNYSDTYHWEEDSESNETLNNEDHDDLKGDIDDEKEEEAATGLWTLHHEKIYDARFETTATATNDHMEKENFTASVGLPNENKIEEEGSVKVDNKERQHREHLFLCDLDKPGSYVVVARGGQGGIGNEIDAQRHYSPQRFQQSMVRAQSTPGESVFLELELKLIADVGLVGFPNAGKSSLLAAMSRAQPKIAPYPFTTLHPLVGIIEYKDGLRVATADIPGLIEGAHVGRGRGYEFLRHLERTKALLYIVDAAGVDGRDPLDDIRILAEELASYGNGELLYDRNALIVANKVDLIPTAEERDELLVEIGLAAELSGIKIFDDNDNQTQVLGISAGVTGEGLPLLSKKIRSIVLHTEAERHASSSSSAPDQTNNNRILFESESYRN